MEAIPYFVMDGIANANTTTQMLSGMVWSVRSDIAPYRSVNHRNIPCTAVTVRPKRKYSASAIAPEAISVAGNRQTILFSRRTRQRIHPIPTAAPIHRSTARISGIPNVLMRLESGLTMSASPIAFRHLS